MKLGELLIQSRKRQNKSREDIANEIGVPIQEIKEWEVNDVLPRTMSIYYAMVESYQLDEKELKSVLIDYFWSKDTEDEWDAFTKDMDEEKFDGFVREILSCWKSEGKHRFSVLMLEMVLAIKVSSNYESALKCFRVMQFNDKPRYYLKKLKAYQVQGE